MRNMFTIVLAAEPLTLLATEDGTLQPIFLTREAAEAFIERFAEKDPELAARVTVIEVLEPTPIPGDANVATMELPALLSHVASRLNAGERLDAALIYRAPNGEMRFAYVFGSDEPKNRIEPLLTSATLLGHHIARSTFG